MCFFALRCILFLNNWPYILMLLLVDYADAAEKLTGQPLSADILEMKATARELMKQGDDAKE